MDHFTQLGQFDLDHFDLGHFTGVGDGVLVPSPLVNNSLPDRGITASNIVIIYRVDDQNSIDVKDYLIANRPRYNNALTLELDLSSATITNGGDTITQAHLTQYILEPLSDFLDDHPEVMYAYLSWAIPLRVKENEAIPLAPTYPSVQYQIAHLDDDDAVDMYDPYTDERQDEIPFDDETALFIPLNQEAFAGTRLLVSSFWFLTLTDFYNHINWIKSVYNSLNTANQGICISGKAANVSGDTYLLDDNRIGTGLDGSLLDNAVWSRDFILHENSSADYDFRPDASTIITSGTNPKGFHNWGYHTAEFAEPFTATEAWESNGSLTLSGDRCRWYPALIEESYVCVRNNDTFPVIKTRLGFFSSTAGGRTNYEGSAIFLVGTVEEPYNGLNLGNYFGLWERGYPIGLAAWRSRRSIHFSCFGDMFLTIAEAIPYSPDRTVYYDTVFGALSSQLSEFSPEGNTGFLKENTKLPYTHISKSGDFYLERYSCGNQLEQGLYSIHVWAESQDELIRIFDDIEDVYTNSVLPLNTIKLEQNCLEWSGQRIQEEIPGLFHGIVLYNITVLRDISTEYSSVSVSGETLLGAIYNRYNFFPEMYSVCGEFVTSKFQKENTRLPYVNIEDFDTNEVSRTSLTRQEQTNFSFKLNCESLDQLEQIQEVIRKYYDNCVLSISDKTFLCMSWSNNTAYEKEPGIWVGTVNYELLMEKDIV